MLCFALVLAIEVHVLMSQVEKLNIQEMAKPMLYVLSFAYNDASDGTTSLHCGKGIVKAFLHVCPGSRSILDNPVG